MKLVKQSLNYSRTGGSFTVEGVGCEIVGDIMAKIEGIDGVEFDCDDDLYVLCWSKNVWDWDDIKDHYKAAKKQAA